MKPLSDTTASLLGMHVLLMVQSAAKGNADFLMADVADAAMRRFGISRATAFRHVRRATDVLCIAYGWTEGRQRRIAEKQVDGCAEARFIGHLPGRQRRT